MAEWIEGVKCIHAIACGLMVSILLSLAIQANVSYSTSSCDESGTRLNGTFECQYTEERVWALTLFYSGAAIFMIGSFGTCMSSGYIIIFYVMAFITWMSVIGGLTIYRMTFNKMDIFDAFAMITTEMIREEWNIWATILWWVIGISFVTSLGSSIVMAIILVLLTHVGWYDHKHILMQCSRDKSRIVRSIIQKKFIPILDKYRVSMQMDCPFHPQRDLLWWPETDEEEEHDDELSFQWTCPFCGSTFLCAERLAIHWDESHRFDSNQRDDSVCLAHFCDIMRCDVIIANKIKRRNRMRSQALPKNRKDFENCDSNQMKKLETRCEQIVRQCTHGLLSNVSLKDYRDIENDLIGSICSYLNCDRYLDDYSNEKRNVPLTLCMIIGIIMIGGFCLCYYIVWMLFDSGYKSRTSALMSRKSIEDESNTALNWSEEIKFKKSVSDFQDLSEERIPVSDRPKILITSPSTHRLIRSQPTYHFYHPNKQNQYSSIEEDSWESCVDVSTRTATQQPSSTSTTTATTAAIHSRPESVSRASSHTTSQSNQSNPYNR